MSLTLAMIMNAWILVASISIIWFVLLKPVVVQAQPAFAMTVVNVKIGNTLITYGRRKEYYEH